MALSHINAGNLHKKEYCLNAFPIMLKLFLFVLCGLRAGRSVWYDRHVGIVEAAGSTAYAAVLANSNPAQSIRAARRGEPFPAHPKVFLAFPKKNNKRLLRLLLFF